jgi:hypothetical protein
MGSKYIAKNIALLRVVCTWGEGRPNSVAGHKCDQVLRDGGATVEYNQVRSNSLRRKRQLLRSMRGYFTKSGYSFEERNHVLLLNGGTKEVNSFEGTRRPLDQSDERLAYGLFC